MLRNNSCFLISNQKVAAKSIKLKDYNHYLVNLTWVMVFFIIAGCQSKQNEEKNLPQDGVKERFHADNDIAMTIRSLADAIKVGEPLDSVDYDFRGVLTDGQGTPLYTDIYGIPGTWDIDVIDPGKVLIKNINLGDLLPADLESYILESLKISRDNRLPALNDTNTNPSKRFVTVYALSGGYMRYEVVKDTASNGSEGSMVIITLGAFPLSEDGIQTAA